MKFIFFFFLLLPVFSHAQVYRLSQKIMTGCDMSLATCTSYGVLIDQLKTNSIQAVWTGSPVGTLIIQVSNDIVPTSPGNDPSLNVVNWITYTGSSQAVAGGAGNFLYNMLSGGYKWMRLQYTKTSGTGSLSATFEGKGM